MRVGASNELAYKIFCILHECFIKHRINSPYLPSSIIKLFPKKFFNNQSYQQLKKQTIELRIKYKTNQVI